MPQTTMLLEAVPPARSSAQPRGTRAHVSGSFSRLSPDSQRAQVRRSALQKILDDVGITPAELARMAQLPNANALYNFFNRRSGSLSTETYMKIGEALQISVAALQGLVDVQPLSVLLRTRAEAGRWRNRFDLPVAEQREIALPVTTRQVNDGAFVAEVVGVGAELRWQHGAMLLCMPLPADGVVAPGSWVLLERTMDGRVEVTARQVEVDGVTAWLWPRTKDPHYVTAASARWPFDNKSWRKGLEKLRIAGVVVSAYEPL